MATRMVTKTFAEAAKTLVMRTADVVVYGGTQTWTDEPLASEPRKYGTQESVEITPYSNPLIQSSDFNIIVDVDSWKTVPRVDTTEIIFNEVICSIVLIVKDPVDAAYTITVRAK